MTTDGWPIEFWPTDHFSSRLGHKVKWIIVHSTSSPRGDPYKTTLFYMINNQRKVSVHELVLPRFTVYKMLPDSLAAHHAEWETVRYPDGDPPWQYSNESSWGIELYQVAGQPTPPGIVQVGLMRVALACRRLGLGPDRVLGHREIDPQRKNDPVEVDMDWFRKQVEEIL